MAREAAQQNQPTPKHSRRRRRHRHDHETGHSGNENKSAVSSNAKGRGADGTAQDPGLRVSTWSEPVLDAQSNGRFQYQFRRTRDAYQWMISGSDSGTNPQYLSVASKPSIVHPLDATSATYPASPYVLDPAIKNQPQYYGDSNADASPSAHLANAGEGDHKAEEYYEDERPHDRSTPRRNKSPNESRSEKRGEQRHHRSHSHHRGHSSRHPQRHHHHRGKSHENGTTHQKDAGRGYGHGNPHEKVNAWLYGYEYATR
ncbi:hypothetical protein F5X98DRAFT_39680 [Xylaria grammica]|nr:hypothetical protein F5X98DRAFT_39680 [Xylaria grammica]